MNQEDLYEFKVGKQLRTGNKVAIGAEGTLEPYEPSNPAHRVLLVVATRDIAAGETVTANLGPGMIGDLISQLFWNRRER